MGINIPEFPYNLVSSLSDSVQYITQTISIRDAEESAKDKDRKHRLLTKQYFSQFCK